MRNSYVTQATYQMTDTIGEYILVSETRVPYVGAWVECTGDSVAQQQEQQQATFDSQLMSIFNQQYATQKSSLAYLPGKMQPIIDAGGTGYDPATLASMRTSATDTNAQQYQN